MDREAWCAAAHWVTMSLTQLNESTEVNYWDHCLNYITHLIVELVLIVWRLRKIIKKKQCLKPNTFLVEKLSKNVY